MRKINLFLGVLLFGLFSQTVFSAEITSISGGGGVLVDETNITEETVQTLEALVLTGDFDLGESVSLNFDSVGSDNLNFIFLPESINFVTTAGDVVVSHIVSNSTSVSFDVLGSGTFKLMDIKVLVLNPETEVFEKRSLRIEMDGVDYLGEEFVVDTFLYQVKESFLGATGGSSNDIFKVSDTLSYSFPTFDFDARGDFKIDLSVLGGVFDFNIENTFEIIEGSSDEALSFSVVLDYDGFSFTKEFETGTISIDNVLPSFDIEKLITIPSEKTVLGVGDEIIFTPPADLNGDTIFFSVDFSDIAGTVAEFEDESEAKTIVLEESNEESSDYFKPVYFVDDAGNIPLTTVNTESISFDLQLPIIQNSDLLSIVDGISPATSGSMIHFAVPLDTNGNEITYSVDFSALGGASAHFEMVSESPDFSVVVGSLQEEFFSVDFTIYDLAGNSATSTTNSIFVNNAPPNFDLNCGATFTVVDKGDDNGIVDVSFGGADEVIFLSPDKTLEGCSDLDSFSIDLSSISGNEADNLENKPADGASYSILVGEGDLDASAYSFPIRIFDAFNNYSDFSSGSLNIDNELMESVDFTQSYASLQKDSVTMEEFLLGDVLNINLSTLIDDDLVSLQAQILGATEKIDLEEISDVWEGNLTIISGLLKESRQKIVFSGFDDQGNYFSFLSDLEFLISNDITVIHGGGGGTSNLGNKSTSLRNFVNESQSEKENYWLELKEKELLFQKNLLDLKSDKETELLQKSVSKRVESIDLKKLWEPLTHYDKFQLKMRVSREAVKEKVSEPDKMEKTIKKIMLPFVKEKDWKKYEDRKGGFRVENSLAKLKKGLKKKSSKTPVSYRKTSLNKRGKYGVIKN